MDKSRFLAALIGPVLVAVSISLAINRDLMPQIVEQVADDYMMILFAGVITLLTGLAIVLKHNIWRGWPAIITAFGWIAIVGGTARIVFPRQVAGIAPAFVEAGGGVILLVEAAVFALLGLFLCWKAFRRA